jgi:hypothetical protein
MVLGRGRSITSIRLTIHAKSRKCRRRRLRPRHVTHPGSSVAALFSYDRSSLSDMGRREFISFLNKKAPPCGGGHSGAWQYSLSSLGGGAS